MEQRIYQPEVLTTPPSQNSMSRPFVSSDSSVSSRSKSPITSNHRPFAKENELTSQNKIREKAINKLLSSSHSKRQRFIQRFRCQDDSAGRFSLIKELVHDVLPDDDLEQQEKNALLEFLESFSLEEGIEYSDFYAEIEEAIHEELLEADVEAEMGGDDYFLDEDMEAFDPMADDDQQIICPLCW